MPVVIEPKDFGRWLDCLNNEPRHVMELMRPPDPDFFEAIPVSDKVNKVANVGPELQDAVEVEQAPTVKDGGQLTLF